MFNTSSTSEFKRAFIKQKNISTKLNDIHFDSDKIWSRVNNIYPFLLKSYIHAVSNGIDNLVRVCRKEQLIPIDLDLDRQLFPFANST